MLVTDRLRISKLSFDDGEFILSLVNEPAFKQFIGDRGVRSLADAREYLRDGAIGSYARNGYGLLRVCRKDDDEPVGICGLVKRDQFEFPDLGFAFLERYWANGYAYESSVAVIEHARRELGFRHIIAIVNEDNDSSRGLLQKLGFQFEEMVQLAGEAESICRYSRNI